MITEAEFEQVAQDYNIEVAAIKAVHQVEANNGGFLPDGRLKILFEGHVFWRQLVKKRVDPYSILKQEHRDVLYKHWTRNEYIGGAGEWDRLEEAYDMTEDDRVKTAAVESASYGAFQLMGFNAELVGFKDAFDLYFFLAEKELNHLKVLIKFCEANNLTRHLRSKNWAAFAKGYNGPGYAQNKYDTKLEAAYNKFLK